MPDPSSTDRPKPGPDPESLEQPDKRERRRPARPGTFVDDIAIDDLYKAGKAKPKPETPSR
jgi:hypothetical protein